MKYSDIVHIILEALDRAKSNGLDQIGQAQEAVKQVLSVRPDMDSHDALIAVYAVWE